jgi:thioredoxin-dependent peroxiredoxin
VIFEHAKVLPWARQSWHEEREAHSAGRFSSSSTIQARTGRYTEDMIGQAAPDFSATADDGQTISLSSLRGTWAVLYFYPKDNTPGCSIEANKFEQALPEFQALGATVIGVSTDSSASHTKFREKCNLTFPLLPDTDKSISKAYGVLGGLTGLLGVADRQTFLIDPEGKVAQHWKRVNPMTHAVEVKRELEGQINAARA